MSESATDTASRPWRLAIEILPVAALILLMLWDVHYVLTPLVVFPLLLFALWPLRDTLLGQRTIVLVSLVFAVWLINEIGGVLVPFVLAFGIAYLLAPAVNWLQQRGMPRALAIILVILPFIAALAALVLLLIPALAHQVVDVAGRVPSLIKRVIDWIIALRARLVASGGAGILSDEQVQRLQAFQPSDLTSFVTGKSDAIFQNVWTAALGVGRGVGMGLAVVLTILGYFIVLPFATFYLLSSWSSLLKHLEDMVPPANRKQMFGFLKEYDALLSKFVRGQLIEATLVGTLTAVGLGLVGFPVAILMGVIAGVCNLVPTIGLFAGLIPGILIALTAPDIGSALLKLGVVYGLVQIMDGQVTGPRIVGGSVGLSPIWMMISVLVFGSLFGFVGLFLAVPLAALVKMVLVRMRDRYQKSPAYMRQAT